MQSLTFLYSKAIASGFPLLLFAFTEGKATIFRNENHLLRVTIRVASAFDVVVLFVPCVWCSDSFSLYA
jgi:hypothetical protein